MAAGRRRLDPGAWRAIVYAVLVHLTALALFALGLRWGQPGRLPQPEPIPAVLVPAKEQPRPPAAAAKAAAEPQPAEVRRRQEEQAQAERERRLALQKKQQEERQRRLEEARARAEADKRRRLEEEKRRAAERARKEQQAALRQQQAEQALRAQLEEEERARAEAARRAELLVAAERYRDLIRQKVERNWSRPAGVRQGLECIVRVRLAAGGEVIEARVVRGSGEAAFDRSVERAVYKAAPLPVPDSVELFEQFRELQFIFKPQE